MNSNENLKLLTALICLLLAMPANAQRWFDIVTKEISGDVVSVDIESAKRDRDIVTLWLKTKLATPSKVPPLFAKSGGLKQNLVADETSRWVFDCKSRTTVIARTLWYRADGSVITAVENHANGTPVAPESFAEAYLEFACNLNALKAPN